MDQGKMQRQVEGMEDGMQMVVLSGQADGRWKAGRQFKWERGLIYWARTSSMEQLQGQAHAHSLVEFK